MYFRKKLPAFSEHAQLHMEHRQPLHDRKKRNRCIDLQTIKNCCSAHRAVADHYCDFWYSSGGFSFLCGGGHREFQRGANIFKGAQNLLI